MGKYFERPNESKEEGTVWNFDNAEAQLIFFYKAKFVTDLNEWKLEDAFWDFQTLYMEGKALLKDKERTSFADNLSKVSQARKDFNTNRNPSDEEKGDYYNTLKEAYEELCDLLKSKGLYFREKESYHGL